MSDACCIAGCGRPSAATLDIRWLCRAHFIASCYEQIDEYTRGLAENRFRDANAELVRCFVSECTRQATDLSHRVADLDNLERARLLDILLRAAELSCLLRRSPRKVLAFFVLLRSERLGRAWEENSETRVVSRYGASLLCSRAVEVDEPLSLARLDSGATVRARVVWVKDYPGGGHEIGLEFLHCDNFWDLDWCSVEPSFWQRETAGKPAPS